jgi:pimeloyl-ACP methyl ester carboxylesterase
VIRPDLPGSARSALPAQALSIQSYVESMEALLADLGIETVHVMAHSMGTMVAQHLAVRNPGLVKSLALFGPMVAPPEPARPNILARAAAARGGVAAIQEIADAIVKGATSRETKELQPAVLALVRESVMRQSPEGYAQSCEALANAHSAAIERVKVPTLLVTGDQDGVAPPANVDAMAARIGGSRRVVFEGCGHWTTFEKPQRCMQELEAFYASIR